MENKTYKYSPHFTWKELQCIFETISKEYDLLCSFDELQIFNYRSSLGVSNYYNYKVSLKSILSKLKKMGVNEK